MASNNIAVIIFLLILAVTVLVFIVAFIACKRKIRRSNFTLLRSAYQPIAKDFDEKVRSRINRQIHDHINLFDMPMCYTENYRNPSPSSNIPPNLLYRVQVVDMYLLIRNCILKSEANPPYRRPEDQFAQAKKANILPPSLQPDVDRFCHLYNKARYGIDAFTEPMFTEAQQLLKKLLTKIECLPPEEMDTGTMMINLKPDTFYKPSKYSAASAAVVTGPSSTAISTIALSSPSGDNMTGSSSTAANRRRFDSSMIVPLPPGNTSASNTGQTVQTISRRRSQHTSSGLVPGPSTSLMINRNATYYNGEDDDDLISTRDKSDF